MLSAGSIIGGGFRVLRNRPLAFAAWVALYLVATVATNLATRGLAESMQTGAIAPLSYFLEILPFSLLIVALTLVLFTAAERAVLHDAPDRFFHLRLGMDELRVLLVSVIVTVAVYAALMLPIFAALAIFAGAAAAGGMGTAAATGVGAAAFAVIIVFVLAFGLMIWLYVRLSLAAPLTLIRRKLIIGESWRVTRGHFWSLFGAYLALFLIVIALSVAISALTAGSYWMDLIRGGGNPQAALQAARAQAARQSGPIGIELIIGWILGAFSGTLMLAMIGGAVATAAKALVTDPDRIAETFA